MNHVRSKTVDPSVGTGQRQARTPKGKERRKSGREKSRGIVPKLYAGLTIAGIRIMPILISLAMVVDTILQSYFGVDDITLSMFFGVSYTSLASLWILSKTYRFCLYHRLFIYHATLFNTVAWYDYEHPISLRHFDTVVLLLVMSGIFFAGALWAHMKYGDRKAPDA